MALFRNVDGTSVEMTTEEEADFLASLPEEPARAVPRKLWLLQLAEDSAYHDFLVWKDGEAPEVQIYFNEEASFAEDHANVAAAMTALSLTTSTFFTFALT